MTPEGPFLFLGSKGGAHILVRPSRREFPDATDYWDGNWIYCSIDIVAGGFRGHVESLLRADEFVAGARGSRRK